MKKTVGRVCGATELLFVSKQVLIAGTLCMHTGEWWQLLCYTLFPDPEQIVELCNQNSQGVWDTEHCDPKAT